MKTQGILRKKATPGRVLVVLAFLAIPGFFWFRYLYHEFVIRPSMASPQEMQMRDAMVRAHQDPKPQDAAKSSGAGKPDAKGGMPQTGK